MLNDLNFRDVVPSTAALIGSIPLIYAINANRGRWKSIPKSSVPFIMANYLINSLETNEEWDIVKKVSQAGVNAIAMNYFIDSRTRNPIMRYASMALVASAFPISDYVTEKVIRPDDDHESLSLNGLPFSVGSTIISVISGYVLDNYEIIPLVNMGITTTPLIFSAFV